MFESIFNGKTVQYEIYYYYLDLKPVDTLETSGITWVYQRFLWNKNISLNWFGWNIERQYSKLNFRKIDLFLEAASKI